MLAIDAMPVRFYATIGSKVRFANYILQFYENIHAYLHRSDNSSTFAQRLLYNIGCITNVTGINVRYSAY